MSRSLILYERILPFLITSVGIGSLFSVAVLAQETSVDQRADAMIEKANKLVAVDADGCLLNDNPDEIVVCGAFDANRKHRLPFPELVERGERIKEPIPTGNAEYVNTGRCYIDSSERKCFKGVPIISVSFGGGVSGPAGQLWQVIKPEVPDDDYVKQAQIKATDTEE